MSPNTAITPDEANSAVYIDFEGTQADPTQLLGVLTPNGEFTQFVLDPKLESAARAKEKATGAGDCVIATLDEAVAYISRQLGPNGVVVAWSRHEAEVIAERATPNPAKTAVLSAYRDAKATARRWKRSEHPDVRWSRDRRRGTYTLDRFLALIGYDVPAPFGAGHTGQRLRALHQQLERRGQYQAVTPVTKAKWTKILKHNYHDCHGMRAVTLAAA